MAISDFPEIIEDSPSPFDGEVAIDDYSTVKLRGSNFQQDAYLFTNSSTEEQWLWKTSNLNTLLKEYLVSAIARKLEIHVPRTYFARKGSTLGLLHEWIDQSSELRDTPPKILKDCKKNDIIRLLLLESWVGASDRHGGNYLFSKGVLFGIDFEQSFSQEKFESELSLYFEWLKDSEDIILQEVSRFRQQIIDKEIINECLGIIRIIDQFPTHHRTKDAMVKQFSNICSSLNTNLDKLHERIHKYFHESSVSCLWFS